MNKIDYKGIFGKSVDDNYQELVNRLTMFFDKNIFEVKGNSYEGYHKFIAGITYIMRQDQAGNPLKSSESSILTRSPKYASKHSNVLYDVFNNLVNVLTKNNNTKAANDEDDTATRIMPVYLLSVDDTISIYKNLGGGEEVESMIRAIQHYDKKDELIGIHLSTSPIGSGSGSSSTGVPMLLKLDNPDGMIKEDINYLNSLTFAMPKETVTEMLYSLFGKFIDHVSFTEEEFIEMLKDNEIILCNDDECVLISIMGFTYTILFLSLFFQGILSKCTDPDTGEVDWEEFAKLASLENTQAVVKNLMQKFFDAFSIKFTEFTFDDKKMEIINYRDYFNSRKAIQHPTTTYDTADLEQLYSICGVTFSVGGWEDTLSTEPNISTCEPILSSPIPASILPLKEYKSYISRIREQIDSKYPIPESQSMSEVYDDEDSQYAYSHTWEEGFDYFMNKYGINEDSSYVIFEPQAPISGNIYITDIFNKDYKINTSVESWNTFAAAMIEQGMSHETIDEMYSYIFGVEPNNVNNGLIKDTVIDSSISSTSELPTDEQLSDLTGRTLTHTVACYMYSLTNDIQRRIVNTSKAKGTAIYPAHALIEPLYDGNLSQKYQIYNIIEDEHVILDSCFELK